MFLAFSLLIVLAACGVDASNLAARNRATLDMFACDPAPVQLYLSLSAPQHVSGVDNLIVGTTLTNVGETLAKLIKDPYSILDESPADKFVIRGPGGAPRVLERARRSEDTCEFLTLRPGRSYTLDHKLSDVYNFTRSGAGEYTITVKDTLLYVNELNKVAALTLRTATVKTRLHGQLVSTKAHISSRSLSLHTRGHEMHFDGFRDGQEAQVLRAATVAVLLIQRALRYLDQARDRGDNEVYRTWFGEPSEERYETVRRIYQGIGTDPAGSTYHYECIFTPNFAWGTPCRPRHVHICPKFFEQPESGLDSQAGTLIHEHSHFRKNNGGTEDYEYEETACRDLARTDPDRAIRNADNYQYFAESLPEESSSPDAKPPPKNNKCGWLCKLFGCCSGLRSPYRDELK